MIANETTLHKRPNDTEINKYRSPYGLQKWAKSVLIYNFEPRIMFFLGCFDDLELEYLHFFIL